MKYNIITKLLRCGGLPRPFTTSQAIGELMRVYGPKQVPTLKEMSQKLGWDNRVVQVYRDLTLMLVLWDVKRE